MAARSHNSNSRVEILPNSNRSVNLVDFRYDAESDGVSPGEQRVLRADARRNRESILDAAIVRLGRDPRATVAEIADDAGIKRVTLYGHFSSREELVEAALERLLERGDRTLAEVDLTGDSRGALSRLIRTGWLLTAQAGGLVEAARDTLPAGRLQALHDVPARRVRGLVERGRRDGELRTDVPAEWIAGAVHHLMKGAAQEVADGALEAAAVPDLLVETLIPAFSTGRSGGVGPDRQRDARPLLG